MCFFDFHVRFVSQTQEETIFKGGMTFYFALKKKQTNTQKNLAK